LIFLDWLYDQYLCVLVAYNYWERKHGAKPDEWYWADVELMKRHPKGGMWCWKPKWWL